MHAPAGFFTSALVPVIATEFEFTFTDTPSVHADTVTVTNANPVPATIAWGNPVNAKFLEPTDTAIAAYTTKTFTANDTHLPPDASVTEEVTNTVSVAGRTLNTFTVTYDWDTA